jgi:hypothetical protein
MRRRARKHSQNSNLLSFVILEDLSALLCCGEVEKRLWERPTGAILSETILRSYGGPEARQSKGAQKLSSGSGYSSKAKRYGSQ